jgi:hypothetical protein
MVITYFLNDFEMVPAAPIITGITLVFTFHICCIYYYYYYYYIHEDVVLGISNTQRQTGIHTFTHKFSKKKITGKANVQMILNRV